MMKGIHAMRFNATIEFLKGQRAAIVTLFNDRGEWSGSGRIEVRSGCRSDLYEEGYRIASQNASVKGGTLDYYRVVDDPKPQTFGEFSEGCNSKISPDLESRPANALNLEIGQPMPRCINSQPDNWPKDQGFGIRWLASGGGPLVFGVCCAGNCPKLKGRAA